MLTGVDYGSVQNICWKNCERKKLIEVQISLFLCNLFQKNILTWLLSLLNFTFITHLNLVGTLSPIDLYPKLLNFQPVIRDSLPMSIFRQCLRPLIVTRYVLHYTVQCCTVCLSLFYFRRFFLEFFHQSFFLQRDTLHLRHDVCMISFLVD